MKIQPVICSLLGVILMIVFFVFKTKGIHPDSHTPLIFLSMVFWFLYFNSRKLGKLEREIKELKDGMKNNVEKEKKIKKQIKKTFK